VAALGDSITAGSPLWDPNPAVRAQLGVRPNPKSQYEYWAGKAVRGVRFRNCGVPGETTDQIAARLGACARGADALIVQGGINDIAHAFGGGAPAMSQAAGGAARNIAAMVRRGKRMGLRVLVANLLPWNNGHPSADPAVDLANADLAELGRRAHVPVLPFHRTLEGPPGSGLMRTDLTAEGDHPSIAGYALLGQRAVAPALRRALAGAPPRAAPATHP
jgi:lysophospholipase L1-like esterase